MSPSTVSSVLDSGEAEQLLGERTMLGKEVLTLRGRRRGLTWHADPTCPRFSRHADAPLRMYSDARDLRFITWENARSAPCVTCALGPVLDLAVRSAAAEPQRATRVVLGCAKAQVGLSNGSHRSCSNCKRLREFAARNALTSHTAAYGYQLVAATLHDDLTWFAHNGYALHLVPDSVDVNITEDVLAVAWAARSGRISTDPSMDLPAIRDQIRGLRHATATLNFAAALAVTDPVDGV